MLGERPFPADPCASWLLFHKEDGDFFQQSTIPRPGGSVTPPQDLIVVGIELSGPVTRIQLHHPQ